MPKVRLYCRRGWWVGCRFARADDASSSSAVRSWTWRSARRSASFRSAPRFYLLKGMSHEIDLVLIDYNVLFVFEFSFPYPS